MMKKGGYFKRGLLLKDVKNVRKESQKVLKKIVEFINIINENFKNIHIVLRPHPTENLISGKNILDIKKTLRL